METRWNDGKFTGGLHGMVWTHSATVRQYLHYLVSGTPECDWATWVRHHHLPERLDRVLVLGAGSGWLERALATKRGVGSVIACDLAADTVAAAEQTAREEGLADRIRYEVRNLEVEALPEGSFDAVFANDVLHHITDLEGVYGRIRDALVPGGKLLFNEYVGPNRFQYSDERMALINRYFRLIPDHLRFNPYWGGLFWNRWRTDPAKLAQDDPTEAVRSEDVLPVAKKFFETEAEYSYGGGLLNPLLYEIVGNFDEQKPDDAGLLKLLCDVEDRLTRSGAIQPDFVIYVGRSAGPTSR
ncbi:MAG TPA: class I SAM-dependent methyltransferase [Thermoanaerobaculia bacterium]|nr:class I SAM-dependent methyltransferase [Thermoanaerobaculia bacterium]